MPRKTGDATPRKTGADRPNAGRGGADPDEQPGGLLLTDLGIPAAGVTIRAVERGFGGSERVLEDVTTDDAGRWVLDRVRLGATDVSLKVVTPEGREILLPDAAVTPVDDVEVHVVATDTVASVVPPEYDRLRAAVDPHLGQAALVDAREDDERRDLTFLHDTTGWDARLLALAAAAEAVADTTGVEPHVAYALLRAGLPADPVELAHVGDVGIEAALAKAAEAGIAAVDREGAQRAAATLAEHATSLDGGRLATVNSGLEAVGVKPRARSQFLSLLRAHDGDVDELWRAAGDAGLPVAKLQVAAQLGALTGGVAPLMADLGAKVTRSEDLSAALVEADLHTPAAWKKRIRAVAGRGKVDGLVPGAYVGTTEERLGAYAEDLAAAVRRSFPTEVVARAVDRGELKVARRDEELRSAVAATLTGAAAAGFTLGRTPLHRFLEEHGGSVLANVPDERVAAVTDAVASLQRVYQITTSETGMQALMDAGLDSANAVAALSQKAFVERHGSAFTSVDEAQLVWRRAQQVSAVTISFLGAAKEAASAPALPPVAMPPASASSSVQALVRQVPTLESLFGSLDFCPCEHCRSVLSPAAYLVDLLKFLDPDATRWSGEVAAWSARHGGAAYPHTSKAAWEAAGRPAAGAVPLQILRQRRPDIPALPLTCENTHTALPYIDIVNEILEYSVAKGKLDPAAARDTGTAVSDDLVAEPQHLIPAAYDTLRAASYPPTLPFDLWAETARAFSEHFEVPLWHLRDALRANPELLPATGAGYGRAAVLRERLGTTPAEFALLTPADAVAGWRDLYGLPSAMSENDARAEVRDAKRLARRLQVTQTELVALVRTGFVNPRLADLVTFRALGVSVEDVLRYRGQQGHAAFSAEEHAAFEARLGPAGVAWVEQNAAVLADVLVLADPHGGCGLDGTLLQHADRSPAQPITFVLLALLVRVWRRLGWSIEDTDRLLRTFLPSSPAARTPAAIGPAMASALHGIAQAIEVADRLGLARAAVPSLVVLWSDLDDAAYEELFLRSPGSSPVFRDPLGRHLQHLHQGTYRPFSYDPAKAEDPGAGNVSLRTHLPAVQAALRLTADDVTAVLAARGRTLADAPLDRSTLSALHRHRLLADHLRMRVTDLVTLRTLSGIEPFAPVAATPITSNADDAVFGGTLAFLAMVADVRVAGLDVAELDFLLRHRFDAVGPHRWAADPPLELASALASELPRIRAEHAVPADPLAFDDETVARSLALVLPPAVVDAVMRAWLGEVPVDSDLVDAHLVRRTIPGVGEVGFLAAADVATVFAQPDGDQTADAARREVLAAALLPHVQERLVDEAITTHVATAVGADRELVALLIGDADLLHLPDAPGLPLRDRYRETETRGTTERTDAGTAVTSTYLQVPHTGAHRLLVRCGAAGVPVRLTVGDQDVIDASSTTAELELSGVVHLRAGVPARLALRHPDGADVDVAIESAQLPRVPLADLVLTPDDAVDAVHRAHVLVRKAVRIVDAFQLDPQEVRHLLTNPSDVGGLDLASLPVARVADGASTPAALVAQLRHLADYAQLRGSLRADPADLLAALRAGRRQVSDGADPADVAVAALDDAVAALARLTRRSPEVVRSAVDILGAPHHAEGDAVVVPLVTRPRELLRLWEVLQIAVRLGVDAATLRRWAQPDVDATTATAVRDAVRARYDVAGWRAVAKPIFDRLRAARRDALVAWLLHREGLERIEELFERFLLDPGTEPVVLTSRLRLAISSVQTFVQRVLLNLEPEVHAGVLDVEHWGWMKRYRVWEANRKIFLWPENWLEPELRDDKTHLFAELESALVESDLGRDEVEAAFAGYLRGLETISRLDVRATFVETAADPASSTLHVLARTTQAPHRWFYRNYRYRMWSPWEPITVEIDSDHAVVVPWRGTVHVFWATFLEQGGAPAGSSKKVTDLTTAQLAALTPSKAVEVHLHWTELFDGRWTDPAMGGLEHVIRRSVWYGWTPRDEHIAAEVMPDGAVKVHLLGGIDRAYRLTSKQGAPVGGPSRLAVELSEVYPRATQPGPGRWSGDGALEVRYATAPMGPTGAGRKPTTRPILRKVGSHTMVTPPLLWDGYSHHSTIRDDTSTLLAPFFLSDAHRVLFAEPFVTLTTLQDVQPHLMGRVADTRYTDRRYWEEVDLAPYAPPQGPVGPDDPRVKLRHDAVLAEGHLVRFGDRYVGSAGVIDEHVLADHPMTMTTLGAQVRATDVTGGQR